MTQKLRDEGRQEFWQIEWKSKLEALKDYDWAPINLQVLRYLPHDMRGDLTTRMRTPEPFRSYVGTGEVYQQTGNLGVRSAAPAIAIFNALVPRMPHLSFRVVKIRVVFERLEIIE